MPRKRLAENAHLPDHVRRRRDGYYTWTNPVDGREYGLGRDDKQAIDEANSRNALLGKPTRFVPTSDLTLQRVIEESVPVQATCAVYFLIAGGRVAYVGQSTNVHLRIATHIADKLIAFDRYYIEPCDSSLLDVLETQYIIKFNPPHNRTLHAKRVYGPTTV